MMMVTISLYLQNVGGYSAYQSGLIFITMSGTFALLSVLGGKAADQVNPMKMVFTGLVMMAAAGLIATLTIDSLYFICGFLTIFGLGLGVSVPAVNTSMMRSVPKAIMSTASGIFTTANTLGHTFGVIVSTSVLTGIGQYNLLHRVGEADLSFTQEYRDLLLSVFGSAHRNFTKIEEIGGIELVAKLDAIMDTAFTGAMVYVMIILATLSVFAALGARKQINMFDEK
jgi:MFS family permease